MPFERSAQAARDELSQVVGRLNAAHTDLLALTDLVLAGELWAVAGIRSVEHWLTCFAGLSPSRATDLVTICSRSSDLPRMRASVDAGRLTIDQAVVVAQHTPASHDGEVDEFAGNATVTQLRRALCKYSFPEPEPEPEPAADEDRPAEGRDSRDPGSAFGGTGRAGPDPLDPARQPTQVRMAYRDGRFRMEVSAPAEIGALLEQALNEAKDALFLSGEPHATFGAALEEVATRSLQYAEQVTTSRGSRYRVYVHLGTDRTGWVQQRGALPSHVLDRLTCDGILQPVWETAGAPVNVGRAQHIVPDRTRRLVEDRDRGCRYPGCVSMYHLEVHHLRHWRDGGPTDTDNLACLCAYHHDAHHRGQFQISGNPDRPNGPGGLRFTTATGEPIGPSPSTSRTADHTASSTSTGAGGLPFIPVRGTAPRRYIGPTGETLHTRWIDFGPGTPPPAAGPPSKAPPAQASSARDLATAALRTRPSRAGPEPPIRARHRPPPSHDGRVNPCSESTNDWSSARRT